MTRFSARLGLFAALLLPSFLGAAPRLVAHGGDGRTLLVEENGSWSVGAAGAREALVLPAGGSIERLVERRDGWIAAGTVESPSGRELLFLEKSGSRVRRIAPPASPVAPVRAQPVLLAEADRTLGAAWLEGDERERFAIRFAAWQGSGFGAPLEVAPAGPGSQLALAGAVLADGRILLVWAGFDGQDDEIWAAIGRGPNWSPPVRLGGDNRVPDILPAVVASAAGALVAWSRLDGDEYRLAMAAFDGKSFGAARLIGPPGTLAPSFESIAGSPALLYRDARARGWALSEMPRPGEFGRTARADGDSRERPAVSSDRTGVVWVFGARTVASGWR
jgi:hypothetical protein